MGGKGEEMVMEGRKGLLVNFECMRERERGESEGDDVKGTKRKEVKERGMYM